MTVLVLALYAEGPSDTRFLPPIIYRTSESIINQVGQRVVDISEPIIVPKKQGSREECIFEASRYASGCHALVVHSDADHRTPDRALRERIQPGFNRVHSSSENVCKNLIPVIPVQMIEAWMLADPETLREVIGTDISTQNLGLPNKAAQVEFDSDPKRTLREVVQKANVARSRRRQIDLSTRYERLARQISLERLSNVPSYKQFVHDLAKTLAELQFIPLNAVPVIRRL